MQKRRFYSQKDLQGVFLILSRLKKTSKFSGQKFKHNIVSQKMHTGVALYKRGYGGGSWRMLSQGGIFNNIQEIKILKGYVESVTIDLIKSSCEGKAVDTGEFQFRYKQQVSA